MPYKSNNISYQLGFYCLLIFLFLRPIVSALEKYIPIPIHIIIPILLTYFLLILILLNFRNIQFDTINFLILLLFLYSAISALWGSTYENIFRLVSPFIAFVSVRTFANEKRKLRIIFWTVFIAYVPTIAISSVLIYLGRSVEVVNFYTGLSRQDGMFINAHGLCHLMIFFSFLTIYLYVDKFNLKSIYKWLMFIVLILSYYNIYNSYVRTGYFAIIIFWSIFTFSLKKKYWILLLILLVILGSAYHERLSTIFWQTESHEIDDASSGRITLWKHNLNLFVNQGFFKKMCGWGLIKYERVMGDKDFPASSHNDYLQLLMEVGLVGLILYISIIIIVSFDVFRLKNLNEIKFVYISSIITFLFISGVTNGWVLRVECGQLFWSFLGGVYVLREKSIPIVK